MENWQVALTVLAAVFVGAALPVLFTLRTTLREANTFLTTVGHSTERSLKELTLTLEKINHTYAELEARAVAPRDAPQLAAAESPLAGVAAAVGAMAAPALLEWGLAFMASRKAAAANTHNGHQSNGDHA
jgi:hypothetical protein